MKVLADLTSTQIASLNDYAAELADQGCGTEVTHVTDEEFSNRVRISVKCDNDFCYSLYMGKRGKIYENPTGDW